MVSISNPGAPVQFSTVDGGESVAPGFGIASDGSHVLYRADHDGDGALEAHYVDLTAMSTPMEVSPPLQNSEPNVFQVTASPDGNSVYYLADLDTEGMREIYRTDVGSPGVATKISGLLPAGSTIMNFQISDDGSALAYLANVDDPTVNELYWVEIANPGVATKVNAVLQASGDVAQYRLDDDGSTIAYSADAETDGLTELYAVDSGSLGVATKLHPPILSSVMTFELTPDGSRVFYVAGQDTAGMNALHSALVATPLTSNVKLSAPVGDPNLDVTAQLFLLPDDESVVYSGDMELNARNRLYRSTITAPEVSELLSPIEATFGGNVSTTLLSPDGSYVVYIADTELDNSFDLFHVDLSSTSLPEATKLNPDSPFTTTDVQSFTISPTGTHVAYRMNPTDGFELFVVDVSDPGNATRVSSAATNGSVTFGFVFSGDGNALVYRGDFITFGQDNVIYTPITASGISEVAYAADSVSQLSLAPLAGGQVAFSATNYSESAAVYAVGSSTPSDAQMLSPWFGPSDVKSVVSY